jgi:periplasmic protein TonB
MSGLGNLSQCMVDSDPEAISRARRLRRKALVISVFLEAVCFAAMLLWPLITPGVLPRGYIMTPIPPYHGGGGPRRATQRLQPPRSHGDPVPRITPIFTYHPHQESNRWQKPSAEDAPDVDAGPAGSDQGPGPVGIGPYVPGGGENGPHIVPPREPQPVQPIRQTVSEGVMQGALLRRVEPVYPVIARSMGLSGTVRLRAIIASDGSVQRLEVLSGSEILARAARQAVEQWRYRPTLLNGIPVEVETYITVTFVLGDH